MIFDSALQFGLAIFFNLGFIARPVTTIYERGLFPLLWRLIAKFSFIRGGMQEFLAKAVTAQLPLHIAGIVLGSPVGYSPS